MRWQFDHQGSWEADSQMQDHGAPLQWRIVVMEDGTFAVNESDRELTVLKSCFPTLAAAQGYCQEVEKVMVANNEKG